MKLRLAILLVVFGALLAPAEMPVPATVEFEFSAEGAEGIKTTTAGDPAYLRALHRSGGEIQNGWWHVAASQPFGEGALRFELERAQIEGDLALVLRTDWQKDTDIAVQLLDATGRALALDLFGETAHNARAVGTDTFVVPLSRYPDATIIVVRRLSGDLRLLGGGLYPVLSAVTAEVQTEKALAERLGVLLSPGHWSFAQGGGREVAGDANAHVGQVHSLPPLAQVNQTGAAVLRQPGYPVYRPLTSGRLVPPAIATANTVSYITRNAVRLIALRVAGAELKPSFTSSPGAAEELIKGQAQLGLMSLAMSSAQKEEFFRQRGHSLLEVSIARDALEILVPAANPVPFLTIPQLDAIFGMERRAGAPAAIRQWSEVGGRGGEIKLVGGYPSYGTTRVFQQLVLKDGPFREEMKHSDVVFSHGVEKAVAEDPDSLGFASLRTRIHPVRSVPVAANSGEPATVPTAETIYSGQYPLQRMFYCYVAARSLDQASAYEREWINLLLSDVGQTLVARSGNLPLLASEVVAQRARLGLPK